MTTFNVANWDPELQALAQEYSPGYVVTAFAVKGSIENEGFHGIDFSDTVETYFRQRGGVIVWNKVEKQMRKELKEVP